MTKSFFSGDVRLLVTANRKDILSDLYKVTGFSLNLSICWRLVKDEASSASHIGPPSHQATMSQTAIKRRPFVGDFGLQNEGAKSKSGQKESVRLTPNREDLSIRGVPVLFCGRSLWKKVSWHLDGFNVVETRWFGQLKYTEYEQKLITLELYSVNEAGRGALQCRHSGFLGV